jgi:hypothetical protein
MALIATHRHTFSVNSLSMLIFLKPNDILVEVYGAHTKSQQLGLVIEILDFSKYPNDLIVIIGLRIS